MDAHQQPPTVREARRTTPQRRKRRWLPTIGALLLVGLIVAGLWPEATPVEIGKATIGPLRSTVNEEGKTRIKQRYVIAAPVAGQLRRIPFKAGAEVTKGESVIAVIDPVAPALLDLRSRALLEARRDTAVANLARAQANNSFSSNELVRAERLAKDNTISPQELENAQWRATSALKELAAAESSLRQAEAELLDFARPAKPTDGHAAATVVKAPISGRVLRVLEESERTVTAGTPLVEIGDPRDLEVIVEVLSRDGAMIMPGTRVELEQWGGAEPLQARVRYVEPAAFTKVSALGVEEQRVYVVADIVTPPEQRANVGDAFRVEARVVMWETNSALKIPSGAVFRRHGDAAVFLFKGGKAKLQKLRIGRTSGSEIQVLEGLKEGDEVVLYPGDRIKDDLRLRRLEISR